MQAFLNSIKEKRFIYISSDGIFDGRKGQYLESDIPKPITLYGRNLLSCERRIQETLSNYCIIRPSYIYGFSQGKLDTRLEQVRRQLLQGKTVLRFNNMYKSLLCVTQVAKAIRELVNSNYTGVLHVAGSRMSVFDFTKEAMKALNVPTENLVAEPCPDDPKFLKDSSLDNSRWLAMTKQKVPSIKQTLSSHQLR